MYKLVYMSLVISMKVKGQVHQMKVTKADRHEM